jgi:hypothetical protein
MKNKLALLLLLFALSFDGLVNKTVGAGLFKLRILDCGLRIENRAPLNPHSAFRIPQSQRGQGQALPLQGSSSLKFLFATLNPDGVNRVPQKRRKPRPRRTAKKAKSKVYAIEAEPAAGAPPQTQSAPEEMPTMAAPPVNASPPAPGEAASPAKKSAPMRKSAPGIKPPTVMIKPPTE